MELFERSEITVIDIGIQGTGPRHTFASRGQISYIDHCAMTRDIATCVTKCAVQEDEIANVSDHLALCVELNLEYMPYSGSHARQQVAWRKLSDADVKCGYTDPLEDSFRLLLLSYGIEPSKILNDAASGGMTGVSDMDQFTDDIVRFTIFLVGKTIYKI